MPQHLPEVLFLEAAVCSPSKFWSVPQVPHKFRESSKSSTQFQETPYPGTLAKCVDHQTSQLRSAKGPVRSRRCVERAPPSEGLRADGKARRETLAEAIARGATAWWRERWGRAAREEGLRARLWGWNAIADDDDDDAADGDDASGDDDAWRLMMAMTVAMMMRSLPPSPAPLDLTCSLLALSPAVAETWRVLLQVLGAQAAHLPQSAQLLVAPLLVGVESARAGGVGSFEARRRPLPRV
eukprot:CAMPEP_0181317306 /NCGR_PEP_ID=MMETSP1101-20121128/16398_1 /TAXON_ID=46948 /ORGANISM="Rhodomonas abbreviata, Strain Caron Lab Isolate" /LENGTH=239 /DNA_ID=CAMNT_0023424691 /DNA_START=346 /DNA_END=1067 /DNA_ORIENTATION=+